MKKKALLLVLAMVAALTISACDDKEEEAAETTVQTSDPVIQVVTDTSEPAQEEPTEDVAEEESIEGKYRSELTNEWIDEELKDQRPIAVMVDNEVTALPHYGLTQYADVVYEITNSKANAGITRLMVLVKDWGKIEQLGSIRSVRPTNLQLIPEWNAVICHDGGPFYIDDYLAKDYVENFSGTFSRVDNGKSREYTEYILPGDLDKNFANKGYSTTYNEYYPGPHYQFASESSPVDLSSDSTAISATHIQMPYKHNESCLDYDPDKQVYLYSEYGKAHVDPGNNNEQLAFKNLLLQNARYVVFDDNGYMMFHSIDFNREGYYITNGKAIEVSWSKSEELAVTQYFDKDGNEITLNTGKTYVALVPDDLWADLEIE